MSQGSNFNYYYAVSNGRQTGVYTSWAECQKQIKDIHNAQYRKFLSKEEAQAFVDNNRRLTQSPQKSASSSPLKSAVPEMKNVIKHVKHYRVPRVTSNDHQWRCHSLKKRNNYQEKKVEWREEYKPSLTRFLPLYKPAPTILGLSPPDYFTLNTVRNEYAPPPKLCNSPFLNFSHLQSLRSQLKYKNIDSLDLNKQEKSIYKPPPSPHEPQPIPGSILSNEAFVNLKNQREKLIHNPSPSPVLQPTPDCLPYKEASMNQSKSSNESNKAENGVNIAAKIEQYFKDSIFNIMSRVLNISVNQLHQTNIDIMQKLTETVQSEASTSSIQSVISKMEGTKCNCGSSQQVELAAVHLRLDAIEKRFDDNLIQVGSLMTEINNLKDNFKSISELLSKHSVSGIVSTTEELNVLADLAHPGTSTESVEEDNGNVRKKKDKKSKKAVEAGKCKKRVRDSTDSVETGKSKKKVEDSEEKKGIIFMMEEDQFVNVYTDGACENNGKWNAKAGIGVWFGPDHPLNVSRPVIGPPTNNTAEIQAVRVAIEVAIAQGINKLQINTDSEFVINCMTKWIHNWKRNGWRLVNKQPVKNKEELEKLDQVMNSITVRWNKVEAHKGVLGNEAADRLAVEGAKLYRT